MVWKTLTWMWDRGFRFLFIVDTVLLFGTMVTINIARFGTSWPTYSVSTYMIGFCLATGIHVLVNYFSGLYERESRLGRRPFFPRLIVSHLFGVAFGGVFTLFTGRYLMPRINIVVVVVFGSVLLAGARRLSAYLENARRGPVKVILVGDDEDIDAARSYFDRQDEVVVVGMTADSGDVASLVETTAATDVLLFDLDAFSDLFPEPLSTLDGRGVRVHQRVSAREAVLGLRSVREIAGMPFAQVHTASLSRHQLRLKRLFDLVVLLVTVPVWLPVLTLLALYVRVVAGKHIIYSQERVGQDGDTFFVRKFRTMHPEAEAGGPVLATAEDGRIVRGMGWMRAMRCDEVPQLWNVFMGQMSLVGPRPERPHFTASFEKQVEGYHWRYEMPPGITGAAQVNGYYDSDASHKLGYDLHYLVNWSLILDLQILLRTVWVVLSRRV